jgi:hypothetical protein
MAWTTPPTFADGDILTASQLNILAENQNYLAGIAGSVNVGFPQTTLNGDVSVYYTVVHSYNNLHIRFHEVNTDSSLRVYYGSTLVYTSPQDGGTFTVNVDLSGAGLTLGQIYSVRFRGEAGGTTNIYYASETEAPI